MGCTTQVAGELTALAEGLGEVATIARKATVDAHVDARVPSHLYAAQIER